MLADLRFALRSLLKTPGFAAIAIVTLALCIGGNSAIFSVVHAILLKPYPWLDSDRLVYVYNSYPLMGLPEAGVSIPDYLDRRAGVEGFADAAIYHYQSFNLAGDNQPERLMGLVASPSLFSTLQVAPALGRVFADADARLGAAATVVLSHAFWQSGFGGDPSVVGRTIRLNGAPVSVIGVMPADFYFPSPRVQLWTPFVFTDAQRSDNERGHEFSVMIARLKPGVPPVQVQRDLDVIQARNAARIPETREFWKTSGFGGRVNGFLEQNVAHVRAMLWLVQVGVAAALLIGCANVASLLLARAVGRERELAIRAALGAGRFRLVRLLLVESLLLFLAGGVLGLIVANWGIAALGGLGLSTLPRAFGVGVDPAIVTFTLLCALATGLVFGTLPAWSASRGDAAAALKEAGTRATAGHRTRRLRAGLVITEIALAVMLLATAGLLMRSFQRLQEVNPGFHAGGVLTAHVDLPVAKYDQPAKLTALHDAILASLRARPGIRAAGVTTELPFTGSNSQQSYTSPEITLAAGAPEPHAQVRSVDPGYLPALGLTLLRGRWFTDADTAGSPHVVVVDQVLADRYWSGGDPVGRHINRDDGSGPPDLWEIVGVVAPVKVQNLEENVTKETIYFPYAQAPGPNFILVARTDGEPAPLVAAVRAAVRSADPEQPVFDVKTMTQRMADVGQTRRAPMVLLSVFSGFALLLAALGVYGVLAFFVTQRQPEFGVRLALGATGRDIAALVLRQGIRLVAVGVVAGLGGYLALSRLTGRLLYGVAPTDPVTLVMAPAILTAAALAACLLPARKATRVDPIIALRAE
ncbi:MAG TPA: ABC transporter permease [Opitutaceae bacterium]|nr:ABC transporter permease [Opitutaceae bacterium]